MGTFSDGMDLMIAEAEILNDHIDHLNDEAVMLRNEIDSLRLQVRFYKRQRELARSHNSSRLGTHTCCVCVEDIHQKYHQE